MNDAASPARMSLDEMADFVCRLTDRGIMLNGDVARVTLTLSPEEVRALDAVARFLRLISPFRVKILNLVNGRR
jgi:hypothetical protein